MLLKSKLNPENYTELFGQRSSDEVSDCCNFNNSAKWRHRYLLSDVCSMAGVKGDYYLFQWEVVLKTNKCHVMVHFNCLKLKYFSPVYKYYFLQFTNGFVCMVCKTMVCWLKCDCVAVAKREVQFMICLMVWNSAVYKFLFPQPDLYRIMTSHKYVHVAWEFT